MMLLIDLGNSSLKYAQSDGVTLQDTARLDYRNQQLSQVLNKAWHTLSQPTSVWVASVASAQYLLDLQVWIKDTWSLPLQVMQTGKESCGIQCAYPNPQNLGVDRWAGIIGACQQSANGVCILDCGTAITLDVVDSNHQHLGGYILPGFEMMETALAKKTAIQNPAPAITQDNWGQDTGTAIWLGMRKAVAALVEQSVEQLQAAGCCDPSLILTGSTSNQVADMIEISHQVREHLVLEGLMAYAGEQA